MLSKWIERNRNEMRHSRAKLYLGGARAKGRASAWIRRRASNLELAAWLLSFAGAAFAITLNASSLRQMQHPANAIHSGHLCCFQQQQLYFRREIYPA